MASVHSRFRKIIKPVVYSILGPVVYRWVFLLGKIRDIEKKLVEEVEMELLPRMVGESDVVLDIGANYAYYTVRLARLCSKGRVFAFEPIPSTFDICRKIVQRYRLKNVSLFQKGVGETSGRMVFEIPLQKLGTSSAGQAHIAGRKNSADELEKYYPFKKSERTECEIVSIDSMIDQLTGLKFVKIDIEGAEYFALRGMAQTLRRYKPHLLLEFCPYFLRGFGIEEAQIVDFLGQLGYQGYRYEPKSRRLQKIDREFTDGNYLFIHEDRVASFADLIEVREVGHGEEIQFTASKT